MGVRKFVDDKLGYDGLLLLNFVEGHAGWLTTAELTCELFNSYYGPVEEIFEEIVEESEDEPKDKSEDESKSEPTDKPQKPIEEEKQQSTRHFNHMLGETQEKTVPEEEREAEGSHTESSQ